MTTLHLQAWPLHQLGGNATNAAPADAGARPGRSRRAVVFVHGILSDHTTFAEARQWMGQDARFQDVEWYYCDYDFKRTMDDNGKLLAEALCGAGFGADDEVAVFAHSMGGLVTRFAVLAQPMPFLKIVFLVGTPNGGALRLAQLSALMQLAHGATNKFFSLFPRWSGVASLSDAARLIETKSASFGNALDVDYVSIPGCYFHADRSDWDLGAGRDSVGLTRFQAAALKALTLVANIHRPHDGIVEEASNNLAKCPRPTEKQDSYNDTQRDFPPTYAHVTLGACNDVTHVAIHKKRDVVDLVCDMIAARFGDAGAPGVDVATWFSRLGREERLRRGLKITYSA